MLETGYNKFKVGDLVLYAPYFEGEGAWVMTGDMGIVIKVVNGEKFQIVKVKWLNPDLDEVDMAADVLVKVENNDENK